MAKAMLFTPTAKSRVGPVSCCATATSTTNNSSCVDIAEPSQTTTAPPDSASERITGGATDGTIVVVDDATVIEAEVPVTFNAAHDDGGGETLEAQRDDEGVESHRNRHVAEAAGMKTTRDETPTVLSATPTASSSSSSSASSSLSSSKSSSPSSKSSLQAPTTTAAVTASDVRSSGSAKSMNSRKTVDFDLMPPEPPCKRMKWTTTQPTEEFDGRTGDGSCGTVLEISSAVVVVPPTPMPPRKEQEPRSQLLPFQPQPDDSKMKVIDNRDDDYCSTDDDGKMDCSRNHNTNTDTSNNKNVFTAATTSNHPNQGNNMITTDNCWTARQVVDAISTCIYRSERIEAIFNSILSLNHNDQELHNEEMSTGIDSAMTKHLTFLVYRYQVQQKEQHPSQHAPETNPISKNSCYEEPPDATDDGCLPTASTETAPLSSSSVAGSSVGTADDYKQEIGLTLEAMELLYRASSHVVGISFQRMGYELIQLLITILDDELSKREESINEAPTSSSACSSCGDRTSAKNARTWTLAKLCSSAVGDAILLRATKILAHLARAGNATRSIAHFPRLLSTLVRILSVYPYECIPWESRLSVLWTLANLACNPDNMILMVRDSPNLVSALIEVASRKVSSTIAAAAVAVTSDDELDDDHDLDRSEVQRHNPFLPTPLERTMETLRSRSIASRALLNLAWLPENKLRLAEQPGLIDVLCELTSTRSASSNAVADPRKDRDPSSPPHRRKDRSHCNKSKTIQEVLVTARRHSAGALRNLAAAPSEHKVQFCSHNDGQILHALTDAALNDTDPLVLERVYGTIHNLANQDTAALILNHPALVLALKNVLLSSLSSSDRTDEYNVAPTNDFDSTEPTGTDCGEATSPAGDTSGSNSGVNSNHPAASSSTSTDAMAGGRFDSRFTTSSPRQHAAATLAILERSTAATTEDMDPYNDVRSLTDDLQPAASSSSSSSSAPSSSFADLSLPCSHSGNGETIGHEPAGFSSSDANDDLNQHVENGEPSSLTPPIASGINLIDTPEGGASGDSDSMAAAIMHDLSSHESEDFSYNHHHGVNTHEADNDDDIMIYYDEETCTAMAAV